MFRSEPTPRVGTRVPIQLALLVCLLITLGSSGILTYHIVVKRLILRAALRSGGSSPEEALRLVAAYLEGDLILAVALVVVGVAVGLATLTTFRAYSRTKDRLAFTRQYAFDILESLSVGVITIDRQARVTAMNERAVGLLGLAAARTQVPLSEVTASVPGLRALAEWHLSEERPFAHVDLTLEREGKRLDLRVAGSFLHTREGRFVGMVLELADVTQLRELEKEAARTERLAGLGTLAAGIAHEIRNPLSAIDIHLQLLREALVRDRGPAKARRYLDIVQTESARLNGIVENFLRFARPSPLSRAPLRLDGLLAGILELVEPECRARGIQVRKEGFPPDGLVLEADEGQLQQAFLNLVLNAVQALSSGGSLEVSMLASPAWVRVEVRDNGPGIPPEHRERIFEPFFTTKEGGTGLGLPIAQRIVSEHGGSIGLEEAGSGTSIVVQLPRTGGPSHVPASLANAHRG
ncbi:MAG: hypothetical protein HYZ53_26005 [Planctomycetes bacterium]|nr:hypothetical protein [Planctomycetota bacterium]